MKKLIIVLTLLFTLTATVHSATLAVEPEVISITDGVVNIPLGGHVHNVRFDLYGAEIIIYSFTDNSGKVPDQFCWGDVDYIYCDVNLSASGGRLALIADLIKPTCTNRAKIDIYLNGVRHYIAVDGTPVDYECMFLPLVRN